MSSMCKTCVLCLHRKYTEDDYDKVKKESLNMMKRRKFLILGSLLGLTSCLQAKTDEKFRSEYRQVEKLIAAVLAHFFPKGSAIPSAQEMHLSQFVYETISHPTYDRDIRAFVIEGAQEFQKRTDGLFASYSSEQKEKALRAYEDTAYGDAWLGRMLTLGMEGLFCDPIYGANREAEGWEALHTRGGEPRPKTRYIGR